MQRIYIALALALCASSVVAQLYPGASGFAKAPLQVVADNETVYTNTSSILTLANANPGELDIVFQNNSNPVTTITNTWNLWWKKVDGKALTATGTPLNATLTAAPVAGLLYSNGYAVALYNVLDGSNMSTLNVYQQALTGGAAPLAAIKLTTATSNTTTAAPLGAAIIGKVVYIFYTNANNTIKYSSVTIGSTANATEYTLSTAADVSPASSLQVIWGEALGSSQLLAYWTENNVAKDTVIDVTKNATAGANIVNWNVNWTCRAYSTDKKYYGEYCWNSVGLMTSNASTTTYIKTNATGGLSPLANYTGNTTIAAVSPYGPYVAVWFVSLGAVPTVYSYELWNLDTWQLVQPRKDYLSINTTAIGFVGPLRVPAGGNYGLLYNKPQAAGALTYSTIAVGLILSGSYLTTVFGFIMTIIAGLFLF